MSAPRWFARPGLVLPIVAGLVVLSALLTPTFVTGRDGDSRLSSYNTEPQGARIFFETMARLGWQPEQHRSADSATSPAVIVAVLNPVVALQMTETHALLEHVRAGGALLVVIGPGTNALEDSLHIRSGTGGVVRPLGDERTDSCSAQKRTLLSLWPDNRALLYQLTWRGPAPNGMQTFKSVYVSGDRREPDGWRPATVGFPYGAGRIVVASDPDFIANDAFRVCHFGMDVAAIQAMDFLRGGGAVPRRRVVFDEFHQGYGAQPGTLRTVAAYLSGTSSGRLFFQLLGAGLLLLIWAAPRPIPPSDPERIERRSPLEHVDALARAYAQVGATRTAALRLLRGLRRRVERGAVRSRTAENDERFLARIDDLHPALKDDVAVIRRAVSTQISRHDFALLGPAVHRIESTLTRI